MIDVLINNNNRDSLAESRDDGFDGRHNASQTEIFHNF